MTSCLQTLGRSWLIFPDIVFPQTSSPWPISQPQERRNISRSLHTWDLEWILDCLWFVVSVHMYFLPNAPSWRNHIKISLFLYWDRILLCSLDGLVAHRGAQLGTKFSAFLLPQSSKYHNAMPDSLIFVANFSAVVTNPAPVQPLPKNIA